MAASTQFIRRPTRRQVIIGVVVLVVVLVASAVWATQRSSAAPAPRLATASTGTVRQTVSASGTIAAAREADLSFGTGGQVTAVTATVGQQVAAGQGLATIDSAQLPSQLAQARAALASDQAKVTADAAASSAQRSADAAAVTAAQAQVAVAQQSLAKATLTSPIAGTVAAVNLTVGQQVPAAGGGSSAGSGAAGSTSTGAAASTSAGSSSTAQVVVLSTNASVVNASVDDTQVGSVKPGLQAQIVPNGATAPVYGVVSSVAMVGSTSAGVATYPVVIAVTGTPAGLHIGATAQVSIITRQLSDVLVVPTAAVRQQGGAASVRTMQNGQEVTVPVTVGLSSGGQTQIVSGISEGTQVVLPTAPAGTGATTDGTARTGGLGGAGGFGGGAGGFGGGGAGRAGGGTRTGGAGGAG